MCRPSRTISDRRFQIADWKSAFRNDPRSPGFWSEINNLQSEIALSILNDHPTAPQVTVGNCAGRGEQRPFLQAAAVPAAVAPRPRRDQSTNIVTTSVFASRAPDGSLFG
jgi:hypothetical protein